MTLGLLDAGARVAAVELDAPAIEETRDAVEDRGAAERFIGIGADVTHGFIAMRWDDSLPPAEAAKKAGAPAAWQQLGRQAIMPERMR
jgi:hypothetical protein